MNKRLILAFIAVIALSGCEAPVTPRDTPRVTILASPDGTGAMAPNLAAGRGGTVLMSWIEPLDGGHALRFSRLSGDTWSPPRTIAAGGGWFANWADFPAIAELDDGTLVAHWLEKSAPATFAYDVMVTRSVDGGGTWTAPERPHTDGTQTEHGFVSLLPLTGGSVLVAWLDGRETGGGSHHAGSHGEGGPMTLRARELSSNGDWGEERLLDDAVCDCCQTAAVTTGRGTTVVYRNRTGDELRDIWVVNRRDGEWGTLYPLHEDGWRIDGCPVNGPALAVGGLRVAAAWFTGADGDPRVYAAFSDDGGDRFGPPVRVDAGDAIGRVGIVMLDDGSALVSWLAGAEIRARRVSPDGTAGDYFVVAESSASRASGFPRIVLSGGRVIAAWTEAGETTQVRTAIIRP